MKPSGRLVVLVFVIAVAILIGAAGMTLRSTVDLIASDRLYVSKSGLLMSIEELKSTVLGAVISERNFLLTGVDSDLRDYETAKVTTQVSISRIQGMAGQGGEQRLVTELEQLLVSKFITLDEMIATRRAFGLGPQVRRILVDRSMELLDRIQDAADTLQNMEKLRLQELERESAAKATVAQSISSMGDLIALLLLAFAFVILQREIARRSLAEASLVRARDMAEAANRAKSEFLANMSHEIRTPLNAILGFSELLAEGGASAERSQSHIEGIKAGGKNLLLIIDDILDLSKIEAGRLDIRYAPVNLFAVVEEVERIFSASTRAKGLAFRIEISDGIPRSVLIDEARLRQVLFNLVGNAIKFTSAGSITVRASSTTPQDGGAPSGGAGAARGSTADGGGARAGESTVDLVIEVQDTGIGIPEDQRQAIFEPFNQGSRETLRFGGTGLGLTISRRLVDMMGGTLSVESQVGKGSTFRVRLGGVKVAAFQEEGRHEEPPAAELEFESQTVLLVEDVESNRRVVREYLQPYRLTLAEAENGQEALELAGSLHPDLILMDMQLPVVDGFEAIRRLKAAPATRRIPVIALTATATGEDVAEIRHLTEGYLRKPISRRELLQELSQFLTHHTLAGADPGKRSAGGVGLGAFLARASADGTLRDGIGSAMREGILPAYHRLRVTLSVNDIRAWCERLTALSGEQDLPELADYARELNASAGSFQIDRVIKALESFEPVTRIFEP